MTRKPSVQVFTSDIDGATVVQIDTADPANVVRVNVNDGELATVFDDGDRIVLAEHHEEFERP